MKRHPLLLIAVIAAGLLTTASAAQAKGASQATIAGPGLKGPIVQHENGELGDLADQSGFFPGVFGQTPDPMLRSRPHWKLGPKYTVTYLMPGPHGTDPIRQDLYPYAESGPVTYTPPGQSFFDGQKTHGGWFLAQPWLKQTLVAAGLPSKVPSASAAGSRSGAKAVIVGVPAGLLLVGAGSFVFLRRRRPPEER